MVLNSAWIRCKQTNKGAEILLISCWIHEWVIIMNSESIMSWFMAKNNDSVFHFLRDELFLLRLKFLASACARYDVSCQLLPAEVCVSCLFFWFVRYVVSKLVRINCFLISISQLGLLILNRCKLSSGVWSNLSSLASSFLARTMPYHSWSTWEIGRSSTICQSEHVFDAVSAGGTTQTTSSLCGIW